MSVKEREKRMKASILDEKDCPLFDKTKIIETSTPTIEDTKLNRNTGSKFCCMMQYNLKERFAENCKK